MQYPGNDIDTLKIHNDKYLLLNLRNYDATNYIFKMRWSNQLGPYPGDGVIAWSDWSAPFMAKRPIDTKPTIIGG